MKCSLSNLALYHKEPLHYSAAFKLSFQFCLEPLQEKVKKNKTTSFCERDILVPCALSEITIKHTVMT